MIDDKINKISKFDSKFYPSFNNMGNTEFYHIYNDKITLGNWILPEKWNTITLYR